MGLEVDYCDVANVRTTPSLTKRKEDLLCLSSEKRRSLSNRGCCLALDLIDKGGWDGTAQSSSSL